jgi:hypothetical protein
VSYKPKPLDTTKIQLNEDLQGLLELLAKNAHDNWASQRIREGWSYGSNRNSHKKEHPCLVPYEQLSEVQKEYDRRAAGETIKALLMLGYHITKKNE